TAGGDVDTRWKVGVGIRERRTADPPEGTGHLGRRPKFDRRTGHEGESGRIESQPCHNGRRSRLLAAAAVAKGETTGRSLGAIANSTTETSSADGLFAHRPYPSDPSWFLDRNIVLCDTSDTSPKRATPRRQGRSARTVAARADPSPSAAWSS